MNKSAFKPAWIVLIYGFFTLAGGVIGYFKAGSHLSLLMGGLFGALLIGSGVLLFKKKPIGHYTALVLSFLLDAFFSYRFLETHKFFQQGS